MEKVTEIAKRTFKEALRDDLTGEAAKVAYYFFLSLFPLVLVAFAMTGLFGGDAAFRWIMDRHATAMPADTASYFARFVRQVTNQPRPGVLSVGILLTLWSASNVFTAFADGLDTMYDVEERRSWWNKRLIALALLVGTSILVLAGVAAILAGGAIGRALGLGAVWTYLRYGLAFALLTAVLWLTYYTLPNREQSRSKGRILIGAVIGALLWVGAVRRMVSSARSSSCCCGSPDLPDGAPRRRARRGPRRRSQGEEWRRPVSEGRLTPDPVAPPP